VALLVHPQSELIREPRLLVPGQQPLGPFRILHDHPLGDGCIYVVLPNRGSPIAVNSPCSFVPQITGLSDVGGNRWAESASSAAVRDSLFEATNWTIAGEHYQVSGGAAYAFGLVAGYSDFYVSVTECYGYGILTGVGATGCNAISYIQHRAGTQSYPATCGAATADFSPVAAGITVPGTYRIIASYTNGGGLTFLLRQYAGKSVTSVVGPTTNASATAAAYRAGYGVKPFAAHAAGDRFSCAMYWNKALSVTEMTAWADSPYDMLAPA
jgi:hypothetical protein